MNQFHAKILNWKKKFKFKFYASMYEQLIRNLATEYNEGYKVSYCIGRAHGNIKSIVRKTNCC